MTDTPDDPRLLAMAEIASLLLANRNEGLETAQLSILPADARTMVKAVRETLAAVGRQEAPVEPPAALRARIMASVGARLSPTRSALLVVDMICDHLEPGTVLEVPRAREIVPALKARIAQARADKTPIIYVIDAHESNDSDLDAWGEHAVRGTKGAEVWPDLAPQEGDLFVEKGSYSAFFESSLEETLAKLGVDSLIVTGCATEIGLKATAVDGLQRGYNVAIPEALQAGTNAELERATLATMSFMPPYGPARRRLLERVAKVA